MTEPPGPPGPPGPPPVGEFAIIERYFAPLAKGEPGAFGLADDAAVLQFAKPAVITTDTLVAGVHFITDAPPGTVAAKSLRVNLSDLAAMGATPRAYTMSLTFGEIPDETWVRDFAAGLARDQETFAVTLIGGDTLKGCELSITITAFGEASPAGLLRRSGAKSGDRVWVSGTIGDGVLGLRAAAGELPELPEKSRNELINRYLIPEPRLALGRRLVGLAGACIDVSDGLIADLGHICRASGLSAIVEAKKVPLGEAARLVLDGNADIMEEVLGGGDDYELLFSAPVEADAAIGALAEELSLPLSPIGMLGESTPRGGSVRVVDGKGLEIAPAKTGYRHF
ncbi:MAG TPA: thiamine-phosphate kinase [Alphaproteobacteria bacterium]|nr:thiamine-phosphate kinase [Alphaproteobacteria bacterium]